MKLVKIFDSIALLFVYITLSIAHLVQLCPNPPLASKNMLGPSKLEQKEGFIVIFSVTRPAQYIAIY